MMYQAHALPRGLPGRSDSCNPRGNRSKNFPLASTSPGQGTG